MSFAYAVGNIRLMSVAVLFAIRIYSNSVDCLAKETVSFQVFITIV